MDENNLQPNTVPTPPVSQEPPKKEVKSPKVILYIILGIVAVLIVGGLILSLMSVLKKVGLNIPGSQKSGKSTGIAVVDLSKYSRDTDSDLIPDFVENDIGLDPAVSEINKCLDEKCGQTVFGQAKEVKHNVLVILDASGSMAIKNGAFTKMEVAKQALKTYVNNSSDKVNIGLLIYGHEGSNSPADKAISCKSAKIVAPIGSLKSSTIDSYLSGISPVGWTPIGLAIQKASEAFVGKEGEKNEIIILSDGLETCDTNPVGVASEINKSGLKVAVNVIGFAVTASEQSGLKAISDGGGGIFATADNSEELQTKFKNMWENYGKFTGEVECMTKAQQEMINCKGDLMTKLLSYFSSQLSSAKLSLEEKNKLSAIQSDITTEYSRKINVKLDEVAKYIREKSSAVWQ